MAVLKSAQFILGQTIRKTMNSHSLVNKFLSLMVVFMLLSLRLGSFTEEIFITPVQDALFHQVFVAEGLPFEGKPIKAKLNLVFIVPITPPDATESSAIESVQQDTMYMSQLILSDILSEIYIPPESFS